MFLVEEVRKLDRSSRWNYTFQVLNLETRQNVEDFTIHAARLPQHRNLNRYRDVLPYDHSRVTLENGSSDYINANFIEVEEIGRKYILAQGPLPDTCGHFWQMIWEQESPAVIMLNKIIEKNSVKCHPYWPMGEDEELEFSDFRIKNLSERSANSYVVRDLQLEQISTGDTRSVKQFHYMLWPDFGVPSKPGTFLNFLYDIRDSDVFNPKSGPAVIHCSAGIGRSGTFCLVDCILKKAELDGKPDYVNVKEMLLKLRQYRVGLVQTPEQLRFSYLAIIEGIVKLYPDLFAALAEDAEESHKRKMSEEDVEPPPIPPRKRPPPPEKPPRHPNSPETNAEEENLKQKKMVKHIQDGMVDESSSEGEEEIIDLSESESEEEVGDFQEVVELSESDEDDRLVDVGAIASPPNPPGYDESFPVHKPLPPLPTEHGVETKDAESFSNDGNKSNANELENSHDIDDKKVDVGEVAEGEGHVPLHGRKMLPVLSVEEEEGILEEGQGNDIETKTKVEADDEDVNSYQKLDLQNDGRLENSVKDVNVEKTVNCDGSGVASQNADTAVNSRTKDQTQENAGDTTPGNKAREETELRQRQRRDEKNQKTAEMVTNIKRKMKEKELAAARWTLTKKSLIAFGISGGLLLLYWWFFG